MGGGGFKGVLNTVTLGVSGALIGDGKKHTSYSAYNTGEYERGYNLKDTSYMRPNLDFSYDTKGVAPGEAQTFKAAPGVASYNKQVSDDKEYDEYINNIRGYWAGLGQAEKNIADQTTKYIDDRLAYNDYMKQELAKNGTATGDRWYRGQMKSSGENKGLLGGGVSSSSSFQGDQGNTLWRLDNEAATNNALTSMDNLYAEQTGTGKGTYESKVQQYNDAVKAYNELQNQRRIHNAESKMQIQQGANSANSGSNVIIREDMEGLQQDAAMLGKGAANDLRNVYSNIDEKEYTGGLDWTRASGLNGLQSASLNENTASGQQKDFNTTKEWSDEELKTVVGGLFKKWNGKYKKHGKTRKDSHEGKSSFEIWTKSGDK